MAGPKANVMIPKAWSSLRTMQEEFTVHSCSTTDSGSTKNWAEGGENSK